MGEDGGSVRRSFLHKNVYLLNPFMAPFNFNQIKGFFNENKQVKELTLFFEIDRKSEERER